MGGAGIAPPSHYMDEEIHVAVQFTTAGELTQMWRSSSRWTLLQGLSVAWKMSWVYGDGDGSFALDYQ